MRGKQAIQAVRINRLLTVCRGQTFWAKIFSKFSWRLGGSCLINFNAHRRGLSGFCWDDRRHAALPALAAGNLTAPRRLKPAPASVMSPTMSQAEHRTGTLAS